MKVVYLRIDIVMFIEDFEEKLLCFFSSLRTCKSKILAEFYVVIIFIDVYFSTYTQD